MSTSLRTGPTARTTPGAAAWPSAAALAGALPVSSALAGHVERATRGARTLPEDVIELIACNPAATARVLAHRAARGGTGAVGGVRAALADLSVADVRAAVSMGPVQSLFDGRRGPEGLASMALEARAVEVARHSAAIVTHLPGREEADAEAAWTAGLLAHIGLAMIDEIGAGAGGASAPRTLHHQAIGGRACRHWRLRDDVADAVRGHGDPCPGPDPVSRAVWLAVRVVRARAGETGVEQLVAAARRCGIDCAQLERVLLGAPGDATTATDVLTPREHDVLQLLADGLVPKQIATELGCTVSTVNNHLHHVYGKLGVASQARALLVARERGWV